MSALKRLEGLAPRGMKLGLEAIDAVCERLDRPERRFPSVLVGGTNGKGSTAAHLAAIAATAGLRTGLYTSPHLIDVTERIRIGEFDVAPEHLEDALGAVFAAAEAAPPIPLTYFEALTAAAFVVFATWRVQLAIVEVGLGGRLDATNVLQDPVLSVVTSVGLDHVADLGPTLPAIAREKAGIFRRKRPDLVRVTDPDALAALGNASNAAGAYWHDATHELGVSRIKTDLDGTSFALRTPRRMYSLQTPLPGEHQAWNAALAVRAAELVENEVPGFQATRGASGIRYVRWPGRLERFTIRGRTVLLDGCHNPEGAAAIGSFLEGAELAGRIHLVFGAMADKDVEGIASALVPRAASTRLVPVDAPRAASVDELLRRVGPSAGVLARPSVEAALRELLASDGAEPIIVAGSLYLVGEARRLLLSGRLETETP